MPRPRQFDEEETVDRAMRLFWERGYEGTSMRDLGAELDLRPGSLYGAFGDKHALFLRALDRYCECQLGGLIAALDGPGAVLPRLRALLTSIPAAIHAGDAPPGCLVVNTTGELVPRDPDATRWVQASFERLEAALAAALQRAQATGEIARDVDPRAAAGLLTTVVQGLQVLAKADPDHPRITATIDLTLAAIAPTATAASP